MQVYDSVDVIKVHWWFEVCISVDRPLVTDGAIILV